LVKKSGTRTQATWRLALTAVRGDHQKASALPGGMTEQELEVQVESEANQYIPFSLDEVSLDFCVDRPEQERARRRGCADRRFAASEKVQDRQGLAEAAGLKPVIVDIESHAARLAAGRLIEALPNKAAWIPVVASVRGRGADHQHAGHSKRRCACTSATRPSAARS
jgi:type IV pilus assembly protein PilM